MSTAESEASSVIIHRMVDTVKDIDKGETRNPLAGMFPETMPQKPIEETFSLPERRGIIRHAPKTIKIARSHTRKMNNKGLYPELNDDQKAAITIYTMECQPEEESVSMAETTDCIL